MLSILCKKLSKWCKNHKIDYDCKVYEENIEVTKKYLDIFLPMFHCFSEMAIQLEEGDLRNVLDRVCHCFLNNQTNTDDAVKFNKDMMSGENYTLENYVWESLILARVSAGRAFTIGQILK